MQFVARGPRHLQYAILAHLKLHCKVMNWCSSFLPVCFEHDTAIISILRGKKVNFFSCCGLFLLVYRLFWLFTSNEQSCITELYVCAVFSRLLFISSDLYHQTGWSMTPVFSLFCFDISTFFLDCYMITDLIKLNLKPIFMDKFSPDYSWVQDFELTFCSRADYKSLAD